MSAMPAPPAVERRRMRLAGPRAAAIAVLLLGLLLATGAAAFDLQAHRGGRGLRPENTLAAFEHALRLGVTTLELDIAITADGVPVISHDPRLNPALVRDAQGRWLDAPGPLIRELTLAELQRYDVGRLNPALAYGRAFAAQQPRDGEPIPTLAALFDRVRELGATAVRFDIETKTFPDRPDDTAPPAQFVDALLTVIRDAGMLRRVTIQSFDWRTLALVQRLEPTLATACLTSAGRGGNLGDPAWTAGHRLADHRSVAEMVAAAGGTTWAPAYRDLDRDAVRQAHASGLQVVPWTVNEPAAIERLLDWGVDGIITDYPDRLRTLLEARGIALPAPLAAPAMLR